MAAGGAAAAAVAAAAAPTAASTRASWMGEAAMSQGLKLVHFSAQLEPCLTHKTPYTP
jgi:hypothetical protein